VQGDLDVSKEITSEYERLQKHWEPTSSKEIKGVKKRVLSAAGRAAIVKVKKVVGEGKKAKKAVA
jgi:hypothetical protein